MAASSLEVTLMLAGVLWAGWIFLLYRLHLLLERIDPALSAQIGRPSLFWTAFNGHVILVRLIGQRDLGRGPHAPLDGLARILRIWALAVIAATPHTRPAFEPAAGPGARDTPTMRRRVDERRQEKQMKDAHVPSCDMR
ncbi:MAG: hypothetical protein WCZ18_02910 [Ottowia sp.]|nr:hypothetical protein [Ottowia sp.]